MNVFTIASIIAVVFGGLFLLWLASLPLANRAFAKNAVIIRTEENPSRQFGTSSFLVSAGVLGVFLVNIATMGLFLAAVIWPGLRGFLDGTRVPLPLAINSVGAALFAVYGLWGTFVLIFNPAYTPFFVRRKGEIALATKGPYALVRHPRYAAEAALNVILFLFTGAWLPLMGILGWVALARQA